MSAHSDRSDAAGVRLALQTRNEMDRTDVGTPTCANCGQSVSHDYVRVFSDRRSNDSLQHCWRCKSRTERY